MFGSEKDSRDSNPLIRGLAIKTLGNLPHTMAMEQFGPVLKAGLKDKDPYVCKTAVLGVSKIYFADPELAQKEGYLDQLESLLDHGNANVVANVVAALIEISSKSSEFDLVIDFPTANKLLSAIEECSEYFILPFFVTQSLSSQKD
jgi:AP-2 complex subunit beta-1